MTPVTVAVPTVAGYAVIIRKSRLIRELASKRTSDAWQSPGAQCIKHGPWMTAHHDKTPQFDVGHYLWRSPIRDLSHLPLLMLFIESCHHNAPVAGACQ